MQPFVPSTPFEPAPGLCAPNSQTVFAHLFRPRRAPPLARERWDTADGDFLHLDFLRAPPEAPHLVVLHGLEGSSRAGYVLELLWGAAARGWGACAVNFRSCSGVPNLRPRMYHSGETGDLAFVLETLRERVSGPLLAAGFSLGANVLLKLLAELGEQAPLRAAAAVSAPFELAGCARAIDAGGFWPRVYRQRFLWSLRGKARRVVRRFPGVLSPRALKTARTLRGYDEVATAPLHGFEGAADYYARCSSGPRLAEIRRPTLLLSAEDDPMVPRESLPPPGHPNGQLTVLRTRHGGHVGFVAGSVLRPRFWAEEQVLGFLERHA